MKITFLGTSAANAFPEAFCQCENCREARLQGGPSLRKRSSLLINDDLLIDLGPDIMTAASMHDCPLTNVQYCIQTHAHADHLDPSHFLSRSPGFGVIGAPLMHFYASGGTRQTTAKLRERGCAPGGFLDPEVGKNLNLEVHQVKALRPFAFGRYEVTAYFASHDPLVESLLYAVESEGRSIFYGTDTAALPEKTWQAFHQFGVNFDLVILDHTYGPEQEGDDHLNAWGLIKHIERMRVEGLIKESGRVFATHIAHEGNPIHTKLAAFASQHGYEVAYDGLTLQV
jgi:phosphoribosyl 1,2-cyclic phosphodiesterase